MSPKTENVGNGIRRDHQTRCTRSGKCKCPYSFWMPQENGQPRKRATVYGSLADARRAKQQATDAAVKRRRTRINRQSGVTPMPTVTDWYMQLMQRSWGQNRISTQEKRERDFEKRIRESLGSKRLSELTPHVIEAWLYKMLDREGNRHSVKAAFHTIEAMLQVAVTHRLLPENPAKSVRYPKEQLYSREHRVLTRKQYDWLLSKGCTTPAERTYVRMLTEAGLRNGEVVALRVSDLELDDCFVQIQRRAYRKNDGSIDIDLPKSHKPRWAAINASLAAELKQHVESLDDQSHDAPVWNRCNRYTNYEVEALTPAASYKYLKTIVARSGILDPDGTHWVSPHVLRKTGASLAVAAGVSPHIAQKQLGHARIETTTRHYLHLPMKEPLRQIGAVFE